MGADGNSPNDNSGNDGNRVLLDVRGLHYSELGVRVREAVANGAECLELRNVHGQRYIGTGVNGPIRFDIHGTPGNDLAAFGNGPRINVFGNAQDACGNTMNDGQVVIHGRAGDIVGYSMRGGKLFVRDDVGYRVGIHMKEHRDKVPVVVIGGTAQPFLGEYMAGGVLVVLGLNLASGELHRSTFIGTGMHGGVIYLRGKVEEHQLGREVGVVEPDDSDRAMLRQLVDEYVGHFGGDAEGIVREPFMKLLPLSKRPYGRLYAY